MQIPKTQTRSIPKQGEDASSQNITLIQSRSKFLLCPAQKTIYFVENFKNIREFFLCTLTSTLGWVGTYYEIQYSLESSEIFVKFN